METESDSQPVEKAHAEPPDGGFRAWFHVFLGHMVFFNTWGVTNSYGIFQQYYTQHLGFSPSSVGWIGGMQVFLLFGVGIFSGRASDAGYFRWFFVSGVALQVLGMLTTSWTTKYWQILLSQGVCVGLGHGLLFTPGLSVSSSYFKKHRSVAVGISAAGAATGGMVYPALVKSLLEDTNVGYPWTMRVFALTMLVTHIPSMVGYRPWLPKRPAGPLVDMEALRLKTYVFFVIAGFLLFWGLYMAFFFMGIYAREEIHYQDSFKLLVIINGVGVIGRIAPSLIGQHYTGIFNIGIILAVASAVSVYCWAAIENIGGLYVWVVVYGLVAGGMQSLFPILATQQAPTANKTGTWTGMALSVVSLANLTAAAIQGAIIQAEGGSYLGAQMFSATSILLGGVFLVLSRCSKFGTKFWIKV